MTFEAAGDLREETVSEREVQERQLTALLNSPETLEIIREFPEKFRELLIGLIVEFWILFPNATSVSSYLQELKKAESSLQNDYERRKQTSPLLVQLIAQEIGIQGVRDDDSSNAIVSYIHERFFRNGFVFHSFNGFFTESIREHGLDPQTRAWDWGELRRIMDIGRAVGTPMLLGWGDINSEGKTSIGDNVDSIYRYGVVSPEWFAQFVCEGWHIGLTPPYDKKAFHKRDHISARRNLEAWIQKNRTKDESFIAEHKSYRNLTDEECTEILSFFEKYWMKFGGKESDPKMVLIPRILVHQEKTGIQSYTDFREASWKKEGTLGECVSMLLSSRYPDLQIQKNIPPSGLRIIDLPKYMDVFPGL